MFIDEKSLIDIQVFWKKVKYRYEAYTEKELKKLKLKDDEIKKFTALNLKAMLLTWEVYNQLQEEATEDNGSERKWNFKKYKESRLIKLFKEWDAKNEKGEPVPLNEANLKHLAPPIAEAILRAYDELSFMTEEEEKNL